MVIERGSGDQALQHEHQADGDQQGCVFVFVCGGATEQQLIDPRPDAQRDRDERHHCQVGIDAEELEGPVRRIAAEDDHRSLREEDDAHGAEDQAQADGRHAIHCAEQHAVDEKIDDQAEGKNFEHGQLAAARLPI